MESTIPPIDDSDKCPICRAFMVNSNTQDNEFLVCSLAEKDTEHYRQAMRKIEFIGGDC